MHGSGASVQRAAEDASVLSSAAVDDRARMQIDARSAGKRRPPNPSQLCSANYSLLCAAADGNDMPSPSNPKRKNERAAAAAAVPGAFGAFNDVTPCDALINHTSRVLISCCRRVASVLIDQRHTPSACLLACLPYLCSLRSLPHLIALLVRCSLVLNFD